MYQEKLGLDIPFDSDVISGSASPLAKSFKFGDGRKIGNRFCIHPMEGWDGTRDGKPPTLTTRRWQKFGRSGAKLIWGGEAAAVRPDGRANPNQLMILDETMGEIEHCAWHWWKSTASTYEQTDDLLVGLQLTHSGRFCRPNEKTKLEPKILYHHPVVDGLFHLPSDYPVMTDTEIDDLILITSGQPNARRQLVLNL